MRSARSLRKRPSALNCRRWILSTFSLLIVLLASSPSLVDSAALSSTRTKGLLQHHHHHHTTTSHYTKPNRRRRRQQEEAPAEELTNNSKDDSSETQRVVIGDFDVIISNTPTPLSIHHLDQMHEHIQAAIFDYVDTLDDNDNNNSDNNNNSITLDYVFLGVMQESFDTNSQKTTLIFPRGGVAAFQGGGTAEVVPTEEEMELWVQQAVDHHLVTQLQQTPLAFVSDARYVSDRTHDDQIDAVVQDRDSDGSTTDSDTSLPLIVSVASVGAVLLAVMAVLVTRRKSSSPHRSKRRRLDDSDDNTDIAAVTPRDIDKAIAASSPGGDTANISWDVHSQDDDDHQPTPPPPRGEETKSVAGSESSFTVNSEAGDSTGLQSLHYGGGATVHSSLSAESFERDRRVNLRKDMLTSPWTGRVVPFATAHAAAAATAESVLQPSHFTASSEHYDQQQHQSTTTTTTTPVEAWDDAGGSASRDELRFESAEEAAGDEAFLKPPSQTVGGRRSGGGGGEIV